MLKKQIMLGVASVLMLTACETTQTIEPTLNDTCAAYCEIQFDRHTDSPETVVQAKGHNAAYRASCPAKKCIIDQQKVDEFKNQINGNS